MLGLRARSSTWPREAALRSFFAAASAAAQQEQIVDVAITGGGMVGSSLAQALASNSWTSGLSVALIDRQAQPDTDRQYAGAPELRVSTLTPASVRLLQQAQVWTDISPRAAAFSQMQVWDWGGNGCIRYQASDIGEQLMGYVAENSLLQNRLLAKLLRPGSRTQVHFQASVQALKLPPYSFAARNGQPPNALAELHLEDGKTIRARLVIGADGARSHTRHLADLRTTGWGYGQHGVVATVRTQLPHGTAWQRFLPRGPLALLPVRDGYSSIVWTTTPQRARQLTEASPLEFALAVNEALTGGTAPARNPLLGSAASGAAAFQLPPPVLEAVGPKPRSFPLTLLHAGRYVRPRFALVGDAAHSVHPLAGQGVNLGLGDVSALVETLAHAVECGRDIGELALLEEMYERPRQRANTGMMAALDGLKRVFTPQTGALALARGLGLDVLNAATPLKGRIMSYAMGA